MNTLALIIVNALLSTMVMVAPPSKPADFQTANLFVNADFNDSPCYSKWSKAWADVICNAGASTVWLNHNNRAGDPSVSQVVQGLKVGAEYELIVGWRGGDHGPIHGVSGARPVFAIDLDGRELKRLSTSSNFTAWMVNDKPAGGSFQKITFKATKTSHTLGFRGEVGADGDVLIDWVQLKGSRLDVCDSIDKLIADIGKLGLSAGKAKALTSKLVPAKSQVAASKPTPAVQQLEAFVKHLNSSGHGLSSSTATSYEARAQKMIAALKSGKYTCN